MILQFTDKNALIKNSISKELETDKHNDVLQNTTEQIETIASPSNHIPIIENINEYELSDDTDDDVNAMIDYNDSLSIIEDINEFAFNSDSESETDTNESQTLAKKYFNKNTTNPALTYMLEHSTLTQNQIMHFIKQNKNESCKTNKNIKVSKDVCLELREDKNQIIDKPIENSKTSENSEDISKSIILENMHNTYKDNKNIELIPSSSDSDIEVEPLKSIEISNVMSNLPSLDNGKILKKFYSSVIPSDEITQTDSESDDFIEVQDIPIFDTSILKNTAKEENIEIAFKLGEKPEDDMFADIFEKADKIKIVTNLEQIKSVNTNYQNQAINFENNSNLECNALPTMFKEPVIKEIKAESQKDNPLTENISSDEVKICDIENSNDQMQQNADMLTDVNLNKCMQEKPIILPTSEEGLIELKVY
jgi:hypothetical protein